MSEGSKKTGARSDLRAQLDRLGYSSERRRRDAGSSAAEVRRAFRRRHGGKPGPQAAPKQEILYRRDLPRGQPVRGTPGPGSGPKVSLEEAVPGEVVTCVGAGTAYTLSRRVDELELGAELGREFRRCLTAPGSGLHSRLAGLCDPSQLKPEDIIFMDVESTGLGSSPLFLIGIMVWQAGGFEVRQFLARNYAEEAAAISMYLQANLARRLLVTFNGKSFDVPFIRARCAVNGITYESRAVHFDLLHECRRIWRDVLPDCKLQTLERRICRRVRSGDIPGAEIPDAYHAFVRSGDARQIVEILRHNMLDLVTLADIMTRFPAPVV